MISNIRPKKSLGQHFLKDGASARRIVESLGLQADDIVLEIGPGGGALTEWLMKSPAGQIIAVETDKRFSPGLLNRFGGDPRFRLIENDILKVDLAGLSQNKKIRIVGNLPYMITSPILFRILENRAVVSDCTATVQKEVAERIVSPPGTKAYGIPSVLFQQYSESHILFYIPRSAFHPVPQVDSAVLKILFLSEPVYPVLNPFEFQNLVRTVFAQRRKMLRNTLKPFIQEETDIRRLPVDWTRRPETLSVREFVLLSDFFSK
jgi:16S rRNA (adenine1518-N6/adenine1519-N6)-dimethyltransferase